MDFATFSGRSTSDYDITQTEEDQLACASEDRETNCWGCGLRVSVAAHASVFKCGWCGAITKEHVVKNDSIRLRRWRDRCFVTVVISFMLFFICAGVWAVYPVIFSISYFCGVFHLAITVILSLCTLSSFCLSAFQPAGVPPIIIWGSYPAVGQGGLQNYAFCHYCSKPKSPLVHHCRSCGTCVLGMDHHCPFRNILAFLRSAVFLSARGVVLVYLFIASFSVGTGLSVLLWQQLSFIYVGKTYLSHLISVDNEEVTERDCQNLIRFFGFPSKTTAYLPSYWKSRKAHEK
ncbi:hypothetical protein SASPL_150708 [Salvia splendens]|uniref:S-acyltransferase n=1 Tax=Salvia splendens TaxID=180675 RepID=A0A8X8W7T7_SALSN|nr:hypothetical protein SASPL_150708 [Salvia splendens]